MSKSLFNEFESVTSKAWKQKIQVDLKGADYNDTLIWNTNDGIDVKPFYHSDEFEGFPDISNTLITNWKACETIPVKDTETANEKALDALNRGAESLHFVLKASGTVVNELLENIDISTTPVSISYNSFSQDDLNNILGIDKTAFSNLTIHFDCIGQLGKTGNWFSNLKEDHLHLERLVKLAGQLSINLEHYQNAGATNVQQLAYALAHANEYLNHLDGILSSQEKENLAISFNVAVGSNYFFEIAKLRALRQLWSSLASEYGINTNCRINTIPSKRNKTIYDYNVNLLRTTTECMSAILGGSDIVSNLAYDALYHEDNEFGSRISRNQLLILKHESYFDKVNNPADGSYYIESLTQQLAEKALELFKDIESNGGFLAQLKEGTIQRKIKESAAVEQADFESGKLVLLGSNKHPNLDDKMKNDLEISPFLKRVKRKTLIEPIIEKRLSEKLEMSRLNKE
ncbi:methylmalonyl-CoA mutase subunit beta [Winogradskyella sp. DF17]|uniref:Methylmalonyl-CoA mutase subunit beta n=1 Tax=Winogradskyella pelagia TaxID=2819984 RepID=A0ABS3T1L9_9FLAO|nr:methylmalonyl-CoA mutase subunit beta [Winogradskyella sp. DF17]MBO3116639.1 methylmalonyl-CoA mutase subunit beta [Winogradskyella sp. DF17]